MLLKPLFCSLARYRLWWGNADVGPWLLLICTCISISGTSTHSDADHIYNSSSLGYNLLTLDVSGEVEVAFLVI